MANQTVKLESPAFTLEPGDLTKQVAGSRTAFRFTAGATRHFDGGFEASINMLVFDAQGRFIGKRGGDRSKMVLANRAAWVHEIENDWLATATNVVYEIEHKFDYRRRVLAGELPELPAAADGSDYYRWLNIDPRTLEDRAVRYDFALWARNSDVAITISQQPKLVTDSIYTYFELDLLDGDRQVCFTRNFSIGLNHGQPAYDDTSISMDRRTLRTLKFFELRGRTECRAISRLVIERLPA